MQKIKPTATERRQKTRNDIYRFIYSAPSSVTKQDVARELHLSLPTVYQNLSELEEAGLIHAAEMQKPSGGRPPVGYEVTADAHYAVGVSLSATEISIVLMDMKGNETAAETEPVRDLEENALLAQLFDALGRFEERHNVVQSKILGIGLTVPGVLDATCETIILSPTMQLKQFPTARMQEQFSVPVSVENDSTCAGIAEYSALSAACPQKNFVYLHLEYGVGGAVFLGGRPWYGEHHRSAEFGHMCVVPGGLSCNCGKRGCLEAYIGAFRFSREQNIPLAEFFREKDAGNHPYQELWNDGIDHLAIAVSNLRRAFDCDVVLGGFMSERIGAGASMDRLRERIRELDIFEEDLSWLRIGSYPRRAGVCGAAWRWIEQYIEQI